MGLLDKLENNDLLPNIEQLPNEMSTQKMEKGLTSEETIFVSHKLASASSEFHSQGKSSIISSDKINSVINKEALILITDIDGVIVYLNEKCSASIGYQPNELVGKHTRIFKTGIHSTEFYRDLWRTLLSGEIWKGEITAKRKDGSVKWYFMLICPLLDDHNQPYQFLTLRFDITEQKNREKQALLKEKQLHSFMGILTDSVVGVIDQNGEIVHLSPAIEVILGYEVSERMGLSIFDIIDSETLPNFRRLIEELKKAPGSSITIETFLKSKKGSLLSCEFTAKNYLHDPILKSIVFAFRDITEQKKFSQELENMVYYDSLTGLPNYKYFEEHLNKELELAKENHTKLAIIQLGLDDFKYVNSTFGHDIGDLLLKEFSNRINSSLTENISMHRISGDLFIFLMKDILDVEVIPETLNSLISLINKEPFAIDGNETYVSVSMGVSVFPYSGEDKDVLLKNAEVAMYRAKNSGKNQFQIFSPTMDLYSYKQFMLRNDSKKALSRDEFSVFYQPRVNPMTNEMVSAEALIRWNHPKWGRVLPDEFISMAEDSGLIVPIGEWVIRKVCYDLKIWEKENLCLKKVSINLSSLQLLQPNFVDMVSSILKELSVNPKWIEFEITETLIIEKEAEVLNTIIQLKNLGITIALDDFGTGYSSLNYLKNFPCEVIKIDKSLIKDIHNDIENHEIIASIIALCHKLKKSVVAEGVETKEQSFILRKLRCNEIQGYFYSKPVDEQEYKELLKNGIGSKKDPSTTNSGINKRNYFRVPLSVPLVADMTIEKIGNKKITIGSTEVIIQNIGPGGLSFYSPLKLPVGKEISLLFITEILSEELKLMGNIVWYKERESNNYQYGIEFTFNNMEKEKIIKILNNFQVKLKHKSILPGCRFYTK